MSIQSVLHQAVFIASEVTFLGFAGSGWLRAGRGSSRVERLGWEHLWRPVGEIHWVQRSAVPAKEVQPSRFIEWIYENFVLLWWAYLANHYFRSEVCPEWSYLENLLLVIAGIYRIAVCARVRQELPAINLDRIQD